MYTKAPVFRGGDKSGIRVMIVAGEASGDLHGAALFQSMRQRVGYFDCIAMGGVAMREAGVSIVVDSTNLGVIGVWDVIASYIPIRLALSQVKKHLESFSPQLLICIDYKEFNLLAARHAKALGIQVLFYVSPQVWAWRSGRARQYGQVIDMMAVIFPFEVQFYKQYSVPVTYVGHPLVQAVKVSCSKHRSLSGAGLKQGFPIIGLLPGSRINEVKRLLPVMLETVNLLSSIYPDVQFVLSRAKSIDERLLQDYLRDCPVTVRIGVAGEYHRLQTCDVAITASGTATLELALLSVPMVIIYKVAPITYWVAKLLVRIPYIGLPNIIAGKFIVPELVQAKANSQAILKQVCEILDNKNMRDVMQSQLAEVGQSLGEMNGIEELSKLAVTMLKSGQCSH